MIVLSLINKTALRSILLLSFFLILASTKKAGAQTQSSLVKLDSIWVGLRLIESPDNDLPPSVNDPKWKDIQRELTIVFYINHPEKISSLHVKYGMGQGKSDLVDFPLTYLKEDNKEYFVQGNKKFGIWKNKVYVTELVPASMSSQVHYAEVRAKDLSGNYSNTLVNKFNPGK